MSYILITMFKSKNVAKIYTIIQTQVWIFKIQTKSIKKMRQMKNLEIFAWCLWIAWKMGEEIHGLDPELLKLGKIQGLDPGLLMPVNTNLGLLPAPSSLSICVCHIWFKIVCDL
jgi:hypothetical protein